MPGDRRDGAEGGSASALIAEPMRTAFELPAAAGQTLLGLLWQGAEAAMIVFDQHSRVLRANPAAERTLERIGCAVGEILAQNCLQEVTIPAGARPYPPGEQPLERALRGVVVSRESVAVPYPGEQDMRRLVLSVQPVQLDDGSCGALMVWNDITDTWDVAERSRTELNRLGQLLEGASDYAIIMIDTEGRIRSWSGAAERMQGYSTEEALGLHYASFFDDGDQAANLPARILAEAGERGKTTVEGKRVRRDGSVFWAHASITAMRDEDGKLRGYVKVTHDVSEQRASEQAAIELNELLEERVTERTVQLEQTNADLVAVNAELEAFSYSVSHDLRAPLRAMSGFAKIMEQQFGAQLPSEALHYVAKVTENAQQMGNLIDALLSFSRMQRQSMESSPIDMTDLVRECWTALAPARSDRRIDFVLGMLPAASGDRRLIQQVWMNLLDNAIKYSGRAETARIEVSAEAGTESGDPAGDLVMYLVKDNGAGFDMRYADKIGQVFQRLHHPEDFTGTGIGLALVQRIVQRHGGTLSAVGEPGVGATFGFTLRRPV
jgi:PAS domain S-box-containing protein